MLFDRVYRLLVGKKGTNSGVEITELRIQFDIEKGAKKNPNKGSLKIYNLKESTRKEMEKPDTRCVLYAGYKEDQGPLLIFQGNVTYAWTHFDTADVITEFELGDGTQEIRDTTISVGYGKKVKSTQVLNDVSKKMGMPLTLPSNAPEREWNNGLSYYGSAHKLLDKVTKGTGLEWSVQNGNLQVIEKGMVTTRTGLLISKDSGMIKHPERQRQDKHEASKKKGAEEPEKQYDGWKVHCLLLPTLNPGDRVKLESRSVEGIFRIESLKHAGDSHAGDWQTELNLVDTAKPVAEQKETKGGVSKGVKKAVATKAYPTVDEGFGRV